jgi:uncharacterized protein (TIGR01244 family)
MFPRSPRSVFLAGAIASAMLVVVAGLAVSAQLVEKADVAGVQNFSRIEPGVSAGGATEPSAVAELARQGYRTVISLRTSAEPGANLGAVEEAARAAGLNYIHVPFDGKLPDVGAIDRFLEAMTDPGIRPVYIYCSSGNRVGALWMARRMLVDGWPAERAVAEARAIGMNKPETEQFVLDYVKAVRRP